MRYVIQVERVRDLWKEKVCKEVVVDDEILATLRCTQEKHQYDQIMK